MSSTDPGTRIQMKTVSEFIVSEFSKFILSKYSLPSGIPDHQFSTDLDFHLTFPFQYWQPVLRDLL